LLSLLYGFIFLAVVHEAEFRDGIFSSLLCLSVVFGFSNPNTSPNGLIKSCVKNKGASNARACAKTIWCLSAASSKRQLDNLIFLA
jgi:hypothetical protein